MAINTKQALGISLRQLLSEKSLDKITVKDITDNCHLNRQTFYYHFQDVYELIEWIFREELSKLVPSEKSDSSWRESFEDIFDFLLANKVLVLNIYQSVDSKTLRHNLIRIMKPTLRKIVLSETGSLPASEEDISFVTDIYTYGLVGFILEWIDDNMNSGYENHLDRFLLLIDGSIEAALKKLISSHEKG